MTSACAILLLMQTRVALFHGAGKPFTLEAVEIPPLAPGELLVQIACATICTSDLHSYAGRREVAAPIVLGHEMVGRVVPPADAPWLAGQRVVWSLIWNCDQCYYCQRDLPQACEQLRKFGHHPSPLMGGFAEHCLLPAGTKIMPVPAGLPDELASVAVCAGATAAAVVRAAGVSAGQSIMICGAGTLGLIACAMATEAGAHVIISEPDVRRREQALLFGGHPRAVLPARGVDAVLELSGHPAAAEAGLSVLRKGGRLILAGSVCPGPPAAWSAEVIVKRQLHIAGVYNYAPRDLRAALDFFTHQLHRYPFAALVQKRFPLAEINQAFAFAEAERPWRAAIYPQGETPPCS